jgi:intein/homing endonuclease
MQKATRGKHVPLNLAYIAGFFDGEGSICITKWINKRNKSHSWQYALYVSVVGTKREVIDFFNKTLSPHRKVGESKYRADFIAYRWGCAGRNALSFLKLIQPYLKLKKPQAKLGIEFQEKKMTDKYDRRGILLTEKDVKWREEYLLKMKELNKRNVCSRND